jgi:hypothetical protein
MIVKYLSKKIVSKSNIKFDSVINWPLDIPVSSIMMFVQGSRWKAIRAKKSPCGCSLRFVLVPKEKWKSPCNFTMSI